MSSSENDIPSVTRSALLEKFILIKASAGNELTDQLTQNPLFQERRMKGNTAPDIRKGLEQQPWPLAPGSRIQGACTQAKYSLAESPMFPLI